MANSGFRALGRRSLKRAKKELDSKIEERLPYAALELRFAMEALTYDRAFAYKEDFPKEEYATWQPKKLMQVLHEIDPSIGSSSTISVGLPDDPKTPARKEEMQSLGTDSVLTLVELKQHYDALGSYLHMPSLKQIEEGDERNYDKLRTRCDALIIILERVLSSTIWNATFGNYSTLEKCLRCKGKVRRRTPFGVSDFSAKCHHCNAEYLLKIVGAEVHWYPKSQTLNCRTDGCAGKQELWKDEAIPGKSWKCEECGKEWIIRLSVGERK